MEDWILQHLWKILGALGTAIAAILGYLGIEIKWKTRIESRVSSLEETRESFRDCLPTIKTDISELKTQSEVQKEGFEWMKKSLERIENKLDKDGND